MKQLLLNPLILSLLALAALIYIAIGFQLISANSRWTKLFERVCVNLLMLSISGIVIGLWGKFNPETLYMIDKTLPSMVLQLGSYAICLVFLYSRLRHTLKNSIFVLFSFIQLNPAFCLYVFFLTLSFLWSVAPTYTLKASLVFLGITLFFAYVGKEYSMKELFNLLLWHHTVLLVMSLIFRASIGDGWSGVLGHKNPFGFTMALTVIFLYVQSVATPKYKMVFLSLAALAVICVQKANSGMGKVLLVVLISLLVFLRFIRRLPPRLAFASMGVFLAVGVSLVILITENAEYIIVEKLGKDMTLTGRTLFWPLVVNAINKHPWLGYGYQAFWQPWLGEANPASGIRTPNFIPQHSHNGYLDMGLYLGWFGLALFIVSLLTNIYYAVLHLTRNKNPESVLPLVIFTWIILSNITENGIERIAPSWMFYVLMTARLTLDRVESKFSRNTQFQKPVPVELSALFNSSSAGEGK